MRRTWEIWRELRGLLGSKSLHLIMFLWPETNITNRHLQKPFSKTTPQERNTAMQKLGINPSNPTWPLDKAASKNPAAIAMAKATNSAGVKRKAEVQWCGSRGAKRVQVEGRGWSGVTVEDEESAGEDQEEYEEEGMDSFG